jgi:hypothetical protein
MARGATATTVGITPEDVDGVRHWVWCTRAANGSKVYTHTESFSNRGAAVRQARALHPGLKITIAAE